MPYAIFGTCMHFYLLNLATLKYVYISKPFNKNIVETLRREHQILHGWTSMLSLKKELSAFLQGELKRSQRWRKGIGRVIGEPTCKSNHQYK